MDWAVAILIIIPAVAFFLLRSPWIIDYLIWITVLNRGIRRYVDWLNGSFNSMSPISLTPLVISGLVFLLIVQNYSSLPNYFRRICTYFGVALSFAFAVGFIRNQFAAVYSLAEYLAPFSIMACAVMARGQEAILDRWIKSAGWAAVVASLYGWYQYYTIPPWDAFWVRAVGFEGYLGYLKPTEMVVFSTMSERGPLAGFLSFAVIPMLVSKRWRNAGSWLSVGLILSVILLTFVRTAIITITLAVVLFPILNRGKNTFRIILILCSIALAANIGLSRLPSSGKIEKRLQSITTFTEDGSFRGRIDIAQHGFISTLKNPIGDGLGSTGLAGRVNAGGADVSAKGGDNGYFTLLFAFGWVGGGCLFYGFYLIWKQIRIFEKLGIRTEALMMFKALYVTGAIAFIAGDWLAGAGSIVFFIFAGFALHPRPAMDRYLADLAARTEHPTSRPGARARTRT